MNMSKHMLVTLVLMLAASGAYALPSSAARATYATEAELLVAPGSAGYAVDDDLTDVDDSLVPLCEEGDHEGEGEDGAGNADDADPGDGGEDEGSGHEGDQGAGESTGDDDDDVGC
jgi:hypothetical protein